MRLETNIPDNTRPQIIRQIAQLTERLSAKPELIEEILFKGLAGDEAIQRMFTPKRLAKIDAAQADVRTGNGRTLQQLEERLALTKQEWLANPSRQF